jgi:hypothetical protein
MAQPTSAAQFTAVSGGVGTTVVKNSTANLYRVIVPGTYVGTLNIHDAAAAAGTTATSQILSLGLPTTSIPFVVEVGVNCKNGITYQATGTPVVTLVWD